MLKITYLIVVERQTELALVGTQVIPHKVGILK